MVPQAGPPPVSSVPSVSSRTDQHNTEVEALHGEANAKCHVSLHGKWSIARVYEPTGEPVREADIGNWAPKHALDAYGPCFADWYSPHAKPCHPHSPSRLRCCIESFNLHVCYVLLLLISWPHAPWRAIPSILRIYN